MAALPWVLSVICSERYAMVAAIGLIALKGNTSGNDSNGVLCLNSFVCVIYNILRHTGKTTVGPPAAKITN